MAMNISAKHSLLTLKVSLVSRRFEIQDEGFQENCRRNGNAILAKIAITRMIIEQYGGCIYQQYRFTHI